MIHTELLAMTALQTAWTVILVAAVLLFLAVEIVVTIGGAKDLRDLLRDLIRESHDPDPPRE